MTMKIVSTQASFPLVTWLIPVRDGMPYIRETLASIAAQTYRDQQVLVWDNGSTDGTVEEVERWIPSRLPGRLVKDQPLPLGQCRARMVESTTTELLAWVDADDVVPPNRLAVQVAYMQAHPRVGLISGALQMTDTQLKPIKDVSPPWLEDADVRWMMRFSCSVAQGAAMFRRRAVLSVGNYLDICPGQDFNLWARMTKTVRMGNVPDLVLYYRQHRQSVSHQNPQQRARLDELGRQRVADILYPNLTEDQYHSLYHLVRDFNDLNVRWSDVQRLRQLAVDSARVCGESDDYFLNSASFRRQYNNLLTRWLKSRPGVAQAWPMLRWAGRLPGPWRKAA